MGHGTERIRRQNKFERYGRPRPRRSSPWRGDRHAEEGRDSDLTLRGQFFWRAATFRGIIASVASVRDRAMRERSLRTGSAEREGMTMGERDSAVRLQAALVDGADHDVEDGQRRAEPRHGIDLREPAPGSGGRPHLLRTLILTDAILLLATWLLTPVMPWARRGRDDLVVVGGARRCAAHTGGDACSRAPPSSRLRGAVHGDPPDRLRRAPRSRWSASPSPMTRFGRRSWSPR